MCCIQTVNGSIETRRHITYTLKVTSCIVDGCVTLPTRLKGCCCSCNILCSPQVLYLQSSGQYLTVSKGGTVGLRDEEDMSLIHTHRLQNSTVRPKDLWVTDIVLLHNLEKVRCLM